MGARSRIVKRLQFYAPNALELKKYATALVERGLDNPELPQDFKEKFVDLVVFLCCVSRQATDVRWSDEQMKHWEDLGLDVAEELSKSKCPA